MKWEYEIYVYSRKTKELEYLNGMGLEGWELVGVVPQSNRGHDVHLIFKRKIGD